MLDAVVLLAEACGITKEKLLSSYPDALDGSHFSLYENFIDKRLSGIPVSYIRKKKEFFGLEFYVDERVLVPRPDTETLVEETLNIIRRNSHIKSVHDVCTGSGCIAIAVKHTMPELYVTASDLSEEALEVFVLNARRIIKNELPHYKSDLLEDVPGTFDIIVSNPPYLNRAEIGAMKKKKWPEPMLALAGGEDGDDILKRVISTGKDHLNPGGWLLIEGGAEQMEEMKKVMEKSGYSDIIIRQDLAGKNRVLKGRKTA